MTLSEAPDDGAADPSAEESSFPLTFPETEVAAVRKAYAAATHILEYGSGGSTLLAADLGKRVVSVESDAGWVDRIRIALAAKSDQAVIHHADIGPTKAWGYPVGPGSFAKYHAYPLSVWDRVDLGTPDLVLIDGRFRLACLAAVCLRATQKTTVLFDDYMNRPWYHAAEQLATLDETYGRMARFTVIPGPIPPGMMTEVIGWFSDPR